jgi:acylphosphatase
VKARITGRVQGVGFRWSTRAKAEELGVAGWVRNLSDGGVEAWIEGEPSRVRAMADWLREGPRFASVKRVELTEAEPSGLDGFEVRPTCVT